jgi:hypothetical protein
MKKINFAGLRIFNVKKSKNKKFFFIFFQQGFGSEKKCIFASLLKYSVRRGVIKQS